jgi:hypothetical protein
MAGKSIAKMSVHPSSNKLSAGNGFDKTKNKWHTERLHYFPKHKEQFDNLDQLAKDFVFKGFGPDTPVFSNKDKVVTMGSCFADRLRRWLNDSNKGAEYIQVPEGLNNSFAVRQYLEWAITGNRSTDAYWYDNDPELGAYRWEPAQQQKQLLKHLKSTKGFVVTFGLSEVWRDLETNNVFWRGVPANEYDSRKHVCQTSTVAENVDNMNKIVDLIKSNLGKDKVVIFTLSPVPLNATFTQRPTIVSDCVSKSILRVALDEFFQKTKHSNVYYWPSFEMVRWVGSHTNIPTLFEDNTPRHVNNEVVKIIISNFISKFFQ